MLDWLKTILGDSYTEEIDKSISQEIGKGFVSRADFNAKNEAVKTLEGQLKDSADALQKLKASEGDTEELKKQIEQLQKDSADAKKRYEEEIARTRLDNAVEAALTAAGAKNNTAVKALLAEFLKSAKTEDDGSVKGLGDEIAKLSGNEATSFLFEAKDGKPQFSGLQPGSVGGKTPPPQGTDISTMSYSELCDYMAAHPEAELK